MLLKQNLVIFSFEKDLFAELTLDLPEYYKLITVSFTVIQVTRITVRRLRTCLIYRPERTQANVDFKRSQTI